jgi:heme/copper-type cytochrome/quinol oxidase subunit 3
MAESTTRARPVKGPPIIESELLAMIIFVFADVMFFAGFISAYALVGARAPAGWWPPPGDPALPVAAAGGASVALLASGVAVWFAGRASRQGMEAARRPLSVAMALAVGFLGYQIFEFVRLSGIGFTLQSSANGGFFYTMVGAHGLHALSAVGVLAWTLHRLGAGRLTRPEFSAIRLYWYFVVLLWPAIYVTVYL